MVCNLRKAKNLFEVLLLSSGDRRFNQFVTCLNILFDCDINNLLEEYNEIKKMTEKIESPHDYMSDQFNYFRVSRVSDFVYSNNRIVQKCHISCHKNDRETFCSQNSTRFNINFEFFVTLTCIITSKLM